MSKRVQGRKPGAGKVPIYSHGYGKVLARAGKTPPVQIDLVSINKVLRYSRSLSRAMLNKE